MANLSVCASGIPEGVETTSGVSSSVLSVHNNGYELSCPRAHRGYSNSLDRRWPFFVGWFRREFDMRLHVVFWSSGITRLVLRMVPMGFFPRTPSFANLSSVDAPDPLTGHSYLLHTLKDFVGTRGLTFVQSVPLPPTHSSDSLSSSVCKPMPRRQIHLLPLAYGVRRDPPIYPANRSRSDGRPRGIPCYKTCSIDSGHCCWDATTQAARDDPQSQCRGWRGVLSFSFEVRMRQGTVTLPCKPLRGVRAPNTSSPLRSVRPEYSMSIIQSIFRLELHIAGVKTTRVYLSTDGKPCLCYLTSPGPGISGLSLSNLSSSSRPFRIPSGSSQVFSSSAYPFHFTKYRSSLID